ncbi:amino acid adenylation domain-containing protein [Actinomadura graeca]|uniref:Amino acid adenylation domain-containing protein n=1 Tax=Actinomadura graeca TaxID=2750812 RepID=A0ABX8QSL8_9ACTN|nr:non-ribosomal peptide synthetase [Actinomadura graeca]QXJ21809.1 amino acid adenylation domain-containing protein [Actinomadura graeca]
MSEPIGSPYHPSFVDAFVRCARAHPDKTAVESDQGRLTYSELDVQSGELASALRDAGAAPGDRVALVMDRGVQVAVALLATLRAGAVYVPMDISWPDNRIRTILDDACPSVVLCDDANAARKCYSAHQTRVRVSDRNGAVSSDHVPEYFDPAYIIYTSGSTGRPKGVVVPHGALAARLYAFKNVFQLTGQERFLAQSSVAFDASILDMFLPLSSGCEIVIASDAQRRDPDELKSLLERRSLNATFATPTQWQSLVSVGWRGCPGMKMLSSGEAMPPSLLAALADRGTVFNAYGPTEATVVVSVAKLGHGDEVHLGKPLPEVELAIEDEEGERVTEVGRVGELFIGGPHLASGYWNNPELTAEKFVGGRYRTGDLASWGPAGCLFYHGRADDQVKVHGHRIELGEIEEVARSQGLVNEIKVLLDDRESVRLVAFYASAGRTPDEIRSALGAELPSYMVPGVWIPVRALPLGTTGKVDRQALLALLAEWRAQGSANGDRSSTPPRMRVVPESGGPFEAKPRSRADSVEAVLLGIWRDVLQMPDLTAESDFFASGGNSVLAVRTVNQARAAGIACRTSDLFANPTVGKLVAAGKALSETSDARAATGDPQRFELLPNAEQLLRGGGLDVAIVRDAYPLTSPQEGMLVRSLAAPESGDYLIRIWCDVHGEMDQNVFRQSWEAEIASQDLLGSVFRWHGPFPFQAVLERPELRWESHDWSSSGRQAAEEAFHELSSARFAAGLELDEKPPLRFDFIDCGGERSRLLLTFHHLLLDGLSIPLLMRRVLRRYNGDSSVAEERVLRFRDYVAWSRRSAGESATVFWRDHLGHNAKEATTSLLADRLENDAGTGAGGGHLTNAVHLNASRWTTVVQRCRRAKITPNGLLQAIWCRVTQAYTQADRVIYGLTQSGRGPVPTGVHEAVGTFVATVPVAVDLDAHDSLTSISRFVQQVNARAAELDHVPLKEIQRMAGASPVRPLFDCLLSFDQEWTPLTIGRLSVVSSETRETTEYPVTVNVLERQNGACDISFSFARRHVSAFRAEGVSSLFENLLEQWETGASDLLSTLPTVPARDAEVPVGRDMRLYILDRRLTPVPIGAPGELCLGGIAPAGERPFAPLVSASWGGAQGLIRTGHRARLLPDGAVEYLGVLAAEAHGRPHPHESAPRPAGEAAHAEPFAGRIGSVPAADPPQTVAEQAMARIWQEILGIEAVGRDDSFFALGGDSILSLQVLAQARGDGWVVDLRDLLRTPKLRDLAGTARREAAGVTLRDRAPARPAQDGRTGFELIGKADRDALPDGIQSAFPLTTLQSGMVYHTHLDQRGAMYWDAFVYEIDGPFAEQAFRGALAGLVARHPLLRARFELAAFSEPLQLIQETAEPIVTVADWREVLYIEQRRRLAAWREDLSVPFDPQRAPLFTVDVTILADDRFAVGLRLYHAIADGWSLASTMTELLLDYQRRLTGEGEPIAAPLADYADFVALERVAVADPGQREFWSSYLGDAETMRLPIRRRVTEVDRRGTRELRRYALPRELVSGLDSLAAELDVPVRRLFLAAHFRVLSMLCGQTDVVSGVVMNGRPEILDADRMIGLFLNAVPLRLELRGGRWRDLVRAVTDEELTVVPYRRYPVSEIKRHCVSGDLFDVAFNYVDFHVYTRAAERLHTVRIRGMEHRDVMNFAFCATFYRGWPYDSELTLAYDPDLFGARQIDDFGRYYLAALRAMAESGDAVYEAPLLDAEERDRLTLVGSPPADTTSLLARVWEHATCTPDTPAVGDGVRALGYKDLAEVTIAIASTLRDARIGPGDVVGVKVRRDTRLPAALLGVMAAGAAYLPLDGHAPADRERFMLADSRAALVLCDGDTRGTLSAGTPTLNLDEIEPSGTRIGAAPLLQPDSSAYLIYTSGSTGWPKGVLVRHRNLDNLLAGMAETPGLGAADRLLATTTIGFDIAALELFLPLRQGAQVIVASDAASRDPVAIIDRLREHDVTVMQATPSLWSQLLDTDWVGKADLKALCGGEALPAALAEPLRRACGELWNLYGPTETTIWSSCAPVEAGEPIRIGMPIADTRMYVLDAHLAPVPRGTTGELCVAGGGVAAGYWNRPELTADRFVSDPFHGGTMYRTGDLVRIDERGTVEYLGRLDHQVKIRGHRIELGEIENILERHPDVGKGVAALHRHPERGEELVGYFTLSAGALSRRSVDLHHVQVAHWEDVWSSVYSTGSGPMSSGLLNLAGWTSSYTDEPMPNSEMLEWIDATVELIRSLGARRILEIGCGTGLLLGRLAPHCDHYVGTDVSAAALEYVREAVLTAPELSGCDVRLEQTPADDLTRLDDERFDLVVLNSVVQYFPGRDYLDQAIGQAVAMVNGSGQVLVGDVRHLDLAAAMYISIADHRGAATGSTTDEIVAHGWSQEKELLVAPGYFTHLNEPGVTRADIMLRRGTTHNELTRFRYDAVLHVRGHVPAVEIDWLEQDARPFDLAEIERHLATGEPFGLRRVANARLARERTLLGEEHSEGEASGLDVEVLSVLADKHGYHARTSWAAEYPFGAFDVAFVPRTREGVPDFPMAARRDRPTNTPLLPEVERGLAGELRRALTADLPEQAVPTRLVLLEAMPLTPNGKVDRKRLPDPRSASGDNAYVAPRNDVERRLCGLWADLLGVERVGVDDHFLRLGGHSLLATRLINRVNRMFDRDLRLRDLFSVPTVAGLAAEIDRRDRPPGHPRIQRRRRGSR